MSKYRVLIVEDDRIISSDLSASLGELGYDITGVAVSGEEAIKSAAKDRPDLVIMDIVLKGAIDGIKAAAHITSQYDIPVVYLTSQSDRATITRAKETGPFGYIMKPYDVKEIGTTLEMALHRHHMERKVKENEQWLSVILSSIEDAVIVAGPDGIVQYMNPAAEKLTGCARRDAQDKHLSEVFNLVEAETGNPAKDVIADALSGTKVSFSSDDLMLAKRTGAHFPIDGTASVIRDDLGETSGVVVVFHDESARRSAMKTIADSERFLGNIFDSIHDPFSIMDRDFRIVRANDSYIRFRAKGRDVVGKVCHKVVEGSDDVCLDCIVKRTFDAAEPITDERKVVLPDGTDGWVEISAYPIFDDSGSVSHVIEYIRNVTSRRRADEERKSLILELEHISRMDPLTGLMNRRALMDFINQEILRTRRYGRSMSLMICDLDAFKQINDTYGHSTGDNALQAVARVFKGMVRKADVAGRYGGDEFVMVMPETSLKGAVELAERVRATVEGISVDKGGGGTIGVTLSIGVALLREKDSTDTLISRADAALYESKNKGRNRVTSSQ